MGNVATSSTTEVLADSSVGDCAPCAPGVSCPLVSEVDMAMHRYKMNRVIKFGHHVVVVLTNNLDLDL